MDQRASGESSEQIVVRAAQAEDREAVFAFCADTWEGGDYIPFVWDDWLQASGERGALLVAVAGERPVGLIHWRLLSDDEAWIEGIRVDPAERRRGIARTMVSRALAGADESGASVARLITDETNNASQNLFGRFGFVRIAEVTRYEAEATEEADSAAAVRLGGDDFARVWSWLEESNLRPFTGGLEFEYWAGHALSEPALRAYLEGGDVWTLEEWGTLQALAVVTVQALEGEKTLESRYTDGTADALGRLCLALRSMAYERGCAKVELWLPNLLILRDAMQGAGYTPGEEAMWIYARDL